jgi:hypothetical protein
MPVTNLVATLTGPADNWVKVGSYDAVTTINTDDDGTSMFRNKDIDIPSRLLFVYSNLPADAVGVNSLTQYAKLNKFTPGSGTGGKYNWVHRYGTTDYLNGYTAFPSPWTMRDSGSIAFGGGGGWTVDRVRDCEYGIRYQDADSYDEASYYYQSYHTVEVDYIASGMFVVTFVLPLLGVLSASFDKIMRQLLPRVRYTREELEKIRQDIRNSQRGYSFPFGQYPVQGLNWIADHPLYRLFGL